ncbi:oligopeptide/dipeptide ABC transporter ATP-binding protein [Falsiroseomonas sp. HW251]|uniref:oligopeptide/dipeptide ABC transporter ATP-binding protein n=1 Tax=Falsiroseomonas sp. HW251 TaxID=3390998 RepID=UPI003D32105A
MADLRPGAGHVSRPGGGGGAGRDALRRAGASLHRALVGAVSVPGRRRGEDRVRLTGEPRSPIDPDPNACRFHGRCPIGQDLCAHAAPPVHALPGGRRVACHFPLTTGALAAA